MTKPRHDSSAKPQKAPRASKPAAPFERRPSKPAAQREAAKAGDPVVPITRKPGAKARSSIGGVRGAIVSHRAASRLRNGHVWVYASDIESLELPDAEARLVPVADSRGLLLGTAVYSPSSQIALRLVSREAIGEQAWLKLMRARLHRAIEERIPLLKSKTAETDSCRLCFSEADELPGLVIDKYGELAILQLLVKGLDTQEVRDVCVRVLRETIEPAAIFERPDPRMRELEGLSAPATAALWRRDGTVAGSSAQFTLNGLKFHFDADAGQKTGAFLDQRANYAAARDWATRLGATGRALDVCTYQGGFALHLAKVCGRVTGIDTSRSSLEVAERNFAVNRDKLGAEVDWVEGDAFEILRDWSAANESFDAIVLDPPAFAKTHRALEGALRGYKELNLRALKMLRAGGLLVTCTCSHHVSWADFEAAVASAAADAHRRVELLERRGAAADHPVILNLPETEYLKCLVLKVVS